MEEEEGLGEEDHTDAVPEMAGDRARRAAVARSAVKAEAKRTRGKGGKKMGRERRGTRREGVGKELREKEEEDGDGDYGVCATYRAISTTGTGTAM